MKLNPENPDDAPCASQVERSLEMLSPPLLISEILEPLRAVFIFRSARLFLQGLQDVHRVVNILSMHLDSYPAALQILQ